MPEKVSFAAFFGPNRNDMTNRANWGKNTANTIRRH